MSSGTGLPFEEALARVVEGAVRNVLNSTPPSRTNTSTSTGTATTITATSTTASAPNIINQQNKKMAQIPKGLGYVKSIPFFLKVGSFVVLLIALGTLGFFLDRGEIDIKQIDLNSFDYWGKKAGLDFGMFVIVVSWLLVMIMVAFFITGLHEKITIINWPLTVAINMIIWSVLLFISGCIIADAARHYDDKEYSKKPFKFTYCDFLKKKGFGSYDARCGHLVAASITCFITAIIFGVDAFFNIQLFRGKGTPSAAPPAVPT